jgi:hypothetical protein
VFAQVRLFKSFHILPLITKPSPIFTYVSSFWMQISIAMEQQSFSFDGAAMKKL